MRSVLTRPLVPKPGSSPLPAGVWHVTSTSVTSEKIVPWPFVTVHAWSGLSGCCSTVTSYASPAGYAPGKANGPSAVMATRSPPFLSTSPLPTTPVTVPPRQKSGGVWSPSSSKIVSSASHRPSEAHDGLDSESVTVSFSSAIVSATIGTDTARAPPSPASHRTTVVTGASSVPAVAVPPPVENTALAAPAL